MLLGMEVKVGGSLRTDSLPEVDAPSYSVLTRHSYWPSSSFSTALIVSTPSSTVSLGSDSQTGLESFSQARLRLSVRRGSTLTWTSQ